MDSQTSAPARKGSILVIDDEEIMREILEALGPRAVVHSVRELHDWLVGNA